MTLLAIATCVAAATDAAAARPFRVADQPLEVRKSLSFGPVNCRDVTEGGKVVFAPDTVRKVDFNGDGRADYIVDFTHTKCGEAKHTFCGTGGCMVDFLVQRCRTENFAACSQAKFTTTKFCGAAHARCASAFFTTIARIGPTVAPGTFASATGCSRRCTDG